MTPVQGSASVMSGFWRDTVMGCFRCDNCGALNIAIAKGNAKGQDPLQWLVSQRKRQWQPEIPPAEPEHDFPDVPGEIATAAREAYACLEVAGGSRAAVLLARSVIEATAKDKGIRKGALLDKIDAMSHMIRPHIRDGAHQVRLLGNDMAHGDFVRDVSFGDADLVLTLMSEVLDDVYQSPARVKRAQDARARRQQVPRMPETDVTILLNTLAKQQKVTSTPAKIASPNTDDQDEPGARPQAEQN